MLAIVNLPVQIWAGLWKRTTWIRAHAARVGRRVPHVEIWLIGQSSQTLGSSETDSGQLPHFF